MELTHAFDVSVTPDEARSELLELLAVDLEAAVPQPPAGAFEAAPPGSGPRS